MSKYPIGFLSYVREDDQHDKGRLTEFRERLSGEVSAQTGERFDIFQDRSDIAWGQNWSERIGDCIDSGTFLICIITPRFLKSEACRAEFARFVERERAIGRNDLILPVYYIDSPVLNDGGKRHDDPVAQLISARNYVDWRALRFESLNSSTAKKALARLALDIREALDSRFGSPDPRRWLGPGTAI